MENHKDRGLGQLYLLGTLVIAALVLGTWGWLEADPTLHWCDALYRAFQLFTLDMPEQNPPLTLEVARWLALIVAFYTVAKVLRTVFTRQKQLRHARLRRNHVVVVGNGPEAASLAGNDTYRKALTECEDYERDVLFPLASRRLPIDLDDGVLVNYLRFGQVLQKIPAIEKKRRDVQTWTWPTHQLTSEDGVK